MDSLRYWVTEMGVDGFRFDLASALARSCTTSTSSPVPHRDRAGPGAADVKLIAEPWDVGEGGYQVGEFPPLWTEWNDKFRDTARDFWRGVRHRRARPGLPPVRLVRPVPGRRPRPYASINFVTAHDGFTMRDLVTYERKHNEAQRRGQPGRQRRQPLGNYGVEGETRGPGAQPAAPPPDPQPAGHPAAGHRGADAHGGRRDGPHARAATTTRTAQDDEITWVDWSVLGNRSGAACST